jgi:UV excision repair protein RAD23
MKLTFRTIKGSTFNVEAEPSTTVGALKAAVEASQGAASFPGDSLKLVYKGKILDDDAKAISEYSVDETGFLVVFVQKKAEPKAAPAPAAAAGGAGSSAAAAAAPPAAEVRVCWVEGAGGAALRMHATQPPGLPPARCAPSCLPS